MGHAVDSAANANTQLAPDASDGTVARPKMKQRLASLTEELIVCAKRKPLNIHMPWVRWMSLSSKVAGKVLPMVAEIPVTVIRSGNNANLLSAVNTALALDAL